MKVGDLVRVGHVADEGKIAMIIEGPNEAGKIKLLLSNGIAFWKHCSEVEYMPKDKRYLHD